MTNDDKIEAEVQRIFALPHAQQVAANVRMIKTLPRDRRERVIAYIRDKRTQ